MKKKQRIGDLMMRTLNGAINENPQNFVEKRQEDDSYSPNPGDDKLPTLYTPDRKSALESGYGNAELNSNMARLGGTDNNSPATNMPTTFPRIPNSDPNLPESYVADIRRRAGIPFTQDLPSEQFNPSNIVSSLFHTGMTGTPEAPSMAENKSPVPTTVPSASPTSVVDPNRNLDKGDAAEAASVGVNPGDKKYHVSRKKQALMGALQALSLLANPQVAEQVGSSGVAGLAALVGSGLAGGALNKNVIGQRQLKADTAEAQAKKDKEIERKGKLATIQNILNQPTQKDADRASREKIAQGNRESRENITRATTAARAAENEKKRLSSDASVSTVKTMTDQDGHIVHRIFYKNGDVEDSPVMMQDKDGNTVPMTSGDWKNARGRLDVGWYNAQTNREQVEQNKETNSSTTVTPKQSRDDIAQSKYKAGYDTLTRKQKSDVDKLYNQPSNLNRSTTTTKGGSKSRQTTTTNNLVSKADAAFKGGKKTITVNGVVTHNLDEFKAALKK